MRRNTPPRITENTASTGGIFSCFFAPKFFAIRTESPSVKPVMVVIKKLMGVVVTPMADSDSSPSTLPTINASAQL